MPVFRLRHLPQLLKVETVFSLPNHRCTPVAFIYNHRLSFRKQQPNNNTRITIATVTTVVARNTNDLRLFDDFVDALSLVNPILPRVLSFARRARVCVRACRYHCFASRFRPTFTA